MPTRRTVFFISDRTGITAEMLGNSLLTQFEDFQFRRHRPVHRLAGEGRGRDPPGQSRPRAARAPPDRVQLRGRRDRERDDPRPGRGADARPVPDLHRSARSRARREELARSGAHARHRQQPRVLHAHGGDQLRAVARRRRRDARTREGAGDPRRACPAAARRRPRSTSRCSSASARRTFPLTPDDFADRQACRLDRCPPPPAVRAHDPARAAARDPRGAAARQPLRLASTTAATRCARPSR